MKNKKTKILNKDNDTVYIFNEADFLKENKMQTNIDFIIKYVVDLFRQHIENDFQLKFFKSSTKELFNEFEKEYPKDFEFTKNKILQTLIEKIHTSQDIHYLNLISDLIPKEKFNPLLTPSTESFNADSEKEYLYKKKDHLKPVIMKLLAHYQADLSFVLSYLQFFNVEIKSKPEILFGKEMYSENNILFKPKKYSINSWWEPIHFNKYEINDFHEINMEDFIKHEKNKYYELLNKNTGVSVEGILKSLLDAMLHDNLKQVYKDNALSYASDNPKTVTELSNAFLESLDNHAKKDPEDEPANKISSEETFDYHSISEQEVIREIIMLEIFSNFSKNEIESLKEELEKSNLYPDEKELKQMLFIIMNPSFSGKSGSDDLIKSYYDIIIGDKNIRNHFIPYFSSFSESSYAQSNLNFVIHKKLALNELEFENWFNKYTSSFSMGDSYSSDKKSLINNFHKNMNVYLDNIFKMSENSKYIIPVNEIQDKMNNEIKKIIEKCQEKRIGISTDEIDTIQIQARIDGYSIKMNLSNPFESVVKPKKRF